VGKYAHLSHIFQYHVCGHVSTHSAHSAIAILTDVVVEANQLSCELCFSLAKPVSLPLRHVDLPFPPFMMTQICEPTHLSMSSGRHQWAHMHDRRQCTYRGAEGFRVTWCWYNGDGQTDVQASDLEVQSRVELVRHVCLAPQSKSASQSPHAAASCILRLRPLANSTGRRPIAQGVPLCTSSAA
jgi:hypothetical protein